MPSVWLSVNQTVLSFGLMSMPTELRTPSRDDLALGAVERVHPDHAADAQLLVQRDLVRRLHVVAAGPA